jgi:hypothetical protein
MSDKYLLPCRCGNQLAVELRQAGETLTCSCGAMVQAPTMLEIAKLEVAPPESVPPHPRSVWGLMHRLRLAGGVLIAVALIGGICLWLLRPISRFDTIDPEQIRTSAKRMTPMQTWDAWEMMRQGLDRRTDQRYAAALLRFRTWEVAIGVVALTGAALIGVAMIGAKGPQRGS